jgi:hypothetical protein
LFHLHSWRSLSWLVTRMIPRKTIVERLAPAAFAVHRARWERLWLKPIRSEVTS